MMPCAMSGQRWFCRCLSALFCALAARVCPAAEYWISTEGDDTWPGSRQKPLRSIQHGVEAFFNGGGSAWSSGISLLEPKTRDNVIRNCVCYGNYDNSSYRTDGNGIIIDNAYHQGGALLINNLCYMNGGKGICSTRSHNCVFLNNTCVANCWQPNQQAKAHDAPVGPLPMPGVDIADGQDRAAINLLLENDYELEWHGMLWGLGILLPEELPLQIEVQGPRKADFLNLSGRFVLRDLLLDLAHKHRVKLVLRQPDECRGLPPAPQTISRRLAIREDAGADERAFVRRRSNDVRCRVVRS